MTLSCTNADNSANTEKVYGQSIMRSPEIVIVVLIARSRLGISVQSDLSRFSLPVREQKQQFRIHIGFSYFMHQLACDGLGVI